MGVLPISPSAFQLALEPSDVVAHFYPVGQANIDQVIKVPIDSGPIESLRHELFSKFGMAERRWGVLETT